MKTSRIVAALLLALPLPIACGGDADGTSGGSGPVNRADAPALLAEAFCDDLGPCCAEQGLAYDSNVCRSLIESEFESLYNHPDTVFDPAAAGRCLDSIKQAVATCSHDPGHDCLLATQGTLPAGAPCTDGLSCASPPRGGAYCDEVCIQTRYGSEGDGCWRTCRAHLGRATCTGSGVPEGNPQPATCFTDENLFCAESGKCEALRAVGEPCTYLGCTAGNYCDAVCKPNLAPGADCFSPEACGTTGYCDLNTNLCAAQKPIGAACADFSECLSGNCNYSGKCSRQGPASKDTCGG